MAVKSRLDGRGGHKKVRETQLVTNRYTVSGLTNPSNGQASQSTYGALLATTVGASGADQAGDIRSKYLGLPVAYSIRASCYLVKGYFRFRKYCHEALDFRSGIRIMEV